MNLEHKTHKKNNVASLTPQDTLHIFYDKLYTREKHDSPDESRTSMVRRIKQLILEKKVNPKSVLNIGSGPQALEKEFSRQIHKDDDIRKEVGFFSVDFADILAKKLLARNVKNVHHTRGDAGVLPFKDQAFGLVVSNHAIDFVEPREEAFREAFRVLNNKGKAIFYFHHPSMLRDMPRDEKVNKFWTYLKDNNILFEDEAQITQFLESIGFSSVEVSLNSDKHKQDTWWEVVVEKNETHN